MDNQIYDGGKIKLNLKIIQDAMDFTDKFE